MPRRRLSHRRFALLGIPALILLGLALTNRGGAAGEQVPATPTYYEHVKPILDARCISCHQPGGIAPFALQTYEQARPHRTRIARAVAQRRMPPWLAAPGHRAYLYDPSLTRNEITTIVR